MNNQSKLQRLLCVAVCFFCIGIMTAFAQEQKVTVELKNATRAEERYLEASFQEY